jgi:uncharacterized protein
MQSQVLGLGEAVGGEIALKTLQPKVPWRWLPGHWAPKRIGAVVANGADFNGPPPDLVISCGRRSVPAALALRKAGALAVHIQDPGIPPECFDLVVPPRHDGLSGPNVLATRAAIHRITASKLEEAAQAWLPTFAPYPHPRVAVFVGGKSGAFQFSADDANRLALQLRALGEAGASLLLTTSRRTGEVNTRLLRAALPDAYLWSGEADGPNPYFGLLALSDHILATCDSASMVSEACATGKPVHVVELPGGNKRFRLFLDGLYQDGIARPFNGMPLPKWTYAPPDDTAVAAARVCAMLARRH